MDQLCPANAGILPRGRARPGLGGSNSLFGSPTVDNALEQSGLGQDGGLGPEAESARFERRAGRGDGSRRRGHRGSTERICDNGGEAEANHCRCSLPHPTGAAPPLAMRAGTVRGTSTTRTRPQPARWPPARDRREGQMALPNGRYWWRPWNASWKNRPVWDRWSWAAPSTVSARQGLGGLPKLG